MTATVPVEAEVAEVVCPPPRWWERSIGWHLAAYALVLLALVAEARPGVATIDEGAYGIQARQVAGGSWVYPEGLDRFDPDGRYFPITLSTEVDGRWFTYLKHPAVPGSMAVIRQAVGEGPGLAVLPLLGALGAAACAWGLAAEWSRRRAPLAFWLAAGSPLAFNAYVTWAHTLSAAFAGAALWAMVRIGRDGPSAARVAWLSAALSAGILVRSESALFALAVLAVLAVVVMRARPARALVAAVVVPGAVLAATMWCERLWLRAIAGGGAPRDLTMRGTTDGPSILVGRVQGGWISVLRGSSPDLFATRGLILPLAVVVGVAVVIRFARSERHEVELALGSLVATFLAVWALWPTSLLTGLVPASPLLVLGVVAVLRRRDLDRSVVWVLVALAVFGGAVLATQYADGGGFQWGGRFFTPLLPGAAAVAALGLGALVDGRPSARRRTTIGSLAVLGLIAGLMPVAVLGATRAGVEPLYAAVAASASPANVTTSEQLPRLVWREDLDWLVAPPDEIVGLLETMRQGGVGQVTAIVPRDLPLSELDRWATVTDRGRLEGTGLRIVVLRQ